MKTAWGVHQQTSQKELANRTKSWTDKKKLIKKLKEKKNNNNKEWGPHCHVT